MRISKTPTAQHLFGDNPFREAPRSLPPTAQKGLERMSLEEAQLCRKLVTIEEI